MSEVKDIIPLKQVSGTKSPNSTTYNWLFKVTTYSDKCGPFQVLRAFPMGKSIEAFMAVFEDESEPSKYGFPLYYEWPGYNRCNYPTGWDTYSTDRSFDEQAVITNVSILDRTFDDQGQELNVDPTVEPFHKENRAWYVNVTFTSLEDSGIFEPPTVTETYRDVTQYTNWGEYVGEYNRNLDESKGVGGTSWSDPLNLENPLIYDRNYNDSDCRLITNSAGIPYDPPVKRRGVKKIITATWVSPFALDFSRAIGKVNCNSVALSATAGNIRSFDGGVRDKFGSEIPNSTTDNAYTIYSHKFDPRTLLLENVDADLFTIFGRDYYRYTAVLAYDRWEHDVFILDEGYETLQKAGWDDPSVPASVPGQVGGPQASFLKGVNQGARQPVHDMNGLHMNRPSLLNGKGRLLMEVNPDSESKVPSSELTGSTSTAVWLRWRVREEVLFSVPFSPTQPDYAQDLEELEGMECPLLFGTKSWYPILLNDIDPFGLKSPDDP